MGDWLRHRRGRPREQQFVANDEDISIAEEVIAILHAEAADHKATVDAIEQKDEQGVLRQAIQTAREGCDGLREAIRMFQAFADNVPVRHNIDRADGLVQESRRSLRYLVRAQALLQGILLVGRLVEEHRSVRLRRVFRQIQSAWRQGNLDDVERLLQEAIAD